MPLPGHLALLIFDLDGTLIDSRADLVASVNAMLGALARPPLPATVVANYVGDGALALVQRALGLFAPTLSPAETALAARGLEIFLAYYADHKLDHTTLYPGVAGGLGQLAAAGFHMAVLSNKPVRPTAAIVAALGLAPYFRAVYGGNSFATKKPAPEGILTLLAATGCAPRQAAMIGDSHIDVQAGRNAGVWTCGVTYGFAPGSLAAHPPDWTADSFPALAAQLCALQ